MHLLLAEQKQIPKEEVLQENLILKDLEEEDKNSFLVGLLTPRDSQNVKLGGLTFLIQN